MSARLEAIVRLAGQGDTVCDVGCDHAHVPIRLLQTGCYRRAIGMDVIAGPLGKAAANLALYGMEDRVQLRLSDGLDACIAGEADTLIVTGMGGTLMEEILLRQPEKTASFRALVLGPQSDPEKVRSALRRLGFTITEEELIFEDGKYYPVIRSEAAADSAGERNGDKNIPEKSPVLYRKPAAADRSCTSASESFFSRYVFRLRTCSDRSFCRDATLSCWNFSGAAQPYWRRSSDPSGRRPGIPIKILPFWKNIFPDSRRSNTA